MSNTIKQIKTLKSTLVKENLIVLLGESNFLTQLVCDEFKKTLNSSDINTINLEAKNETWESFEQKFSDPGFFGEKTSYFIHGLEQTKGFYKFLEKIENKSYFSSPLILIHQKTVTLSNLKKEMKRLCAKEILCKNPKPFETEEILRYLCDKTSLKLKREAMTFLLKKTGTNLIHMRNELQKLSLVLGKTSEELGIKDIAKHINASKEEEAFLLTGLLLEKKLAKAQEHITNLILSGESPLSILGIITYFCRTGLYLKKQKSDTLQNLKRENKIKLPNFLINRYNRHLHLHTEKSLKNVLAKCSESDVHLKTRAKNQNLVFISNVLVAFEA